jgi:predicted O-linked N-acetylglucosamine transferase (SPINDLY family)
VTRQGDTASLHAGLARHRAGDLAGAAKIYRDVLARSPREATALRLLGALELQRDNLDEAQTLLSRAIEQGAAPADAHYLLGVVLTRQARGDAAAPHFRKCISLDPRHATARVALGCLAQQAGDTEAALALFTQAAAVEPGLADAWYNAGKAHHELGRLPEALASYDGALAVQPLRADALNNRGIVLGELARHAEALASFDRAIAARPGYAEAYNNRGVTLLALKRFDAAIASFDRALAARPGYGEALDHRGKCLMRAGHYDAAAADFAALLAIDPRRKYAFGYLVHARMHMCAWDALSSDCTRLVEELRAGEAVCTPFPLLAMPCAPADQLQCARLYVAAEYPPAPDPLWRGERARHDRLRIGYVSGEFREQATSYLIAELLETHDRTRFEVHGISSGPHDEGPMRQRLQAGLEHFIDIAALTDDAAAQLLRRREIDILINLNGYFGEERTGVFARRPAPLAVSYLGFPGTMGADYIDYIIADRHVIPPQDAPHYAEKVVHLPDCYQANDSQRRIADAVPSRRAAGLPDDGFVFCCFNNNHKIVPDMFAVWMNLLRQVPGSVLWLLEGNAAVTRNLRREAESRGVAGARIVFAPRIAPDRHLARHRLADIFLDTLPHNAHTTASDALWTGLPLVTCVGSTFAGRVAASLLAAVGLDDLVTVSLIDYEALALRLARDAALLGAMRRKLASDRDAQPLFDARRLCRHVEAAFGRMWERHVGGKAPDGFAVEPLA